MFSLLWSMEDLNLCCDLIKLFFGGVKGGVLNAGCHRIVAGPAFVVALCGRRGHDAEGKGGECSSDRFQVHEGTEGTHAVAYNGGLRGGGGKGTFPPYTAAA